MLKNKYMLCIDNGLSVGKVALIDAAGSIAGIKSFKNQIADDGCFSEIDMEQFYKNTAITIKELIDGTAIDPSLIMSVANSGHGGGIYLADVKGLPVRKAISSMDSRAERYIEYWKKQGIDSYQLTFTNMWSGQAIPLLAWLKENEKQSYQNIYKILFCKDWIKYRLTDSYSTDYTDASNSGLLNINTKDYDKDFYGLHGVSEISQMLPGLYKSWEITGYVTECAARDTGILKGTPVMCGIVDFVACLIGSGLYDGSAYSIVSGTWGINTALKKDLNPDPHIMSTVLFPDNLNLLAMDTSPNSAVNLEWFISRILEEAGFKTERGLFYKKIDEEIKKITLKDNNIFYFPFIYRSKLSEKMQGAAIGFNASNNIYDILNAIYEGVVFSHLLHINNLKKGGIDLKKAVMSGGATNSSQWVQMFADILNIEIKTTTSKEVGLLGLAIIQAMGLGIYKSLKDAIYNMVRTSAVYRPDKNKTTTYKKRFKKFIKIRQLLDREF
ncbi:MAG: carbohydrate kinase [Actinobacteria bacterium]|nr:carbohydrate kinase [Actinomycetota bacterium]